MPTASPADEAPQYSPSIAAVVVSFNRVALLRQVLRSLTVQTTPLDAVIVIDNASSDGAPEMVAAEFPEVLLFGTGANLGGAGGFAWGVELAAALGFDQAWLMDDDGIPSPNAFEVLRNTADFQMGPRPGFHTSIPVTAELELGSANHPTLGRDFATQYRARASGRMAVTRATFVGLLLNLAAAREVGLPSPEFFIWGDDMEYTDRISRRFGGWAVLESTIVHESPEMHAFGVAKPVGWKYFYLVRNNLWQARWTRDRLNRRQKYRQALVAIRTEFRGGSGRARLLVTTVRALAAGVFARRRILAVGELLRTSTAAQEWVVRTRASRSPS